MGNCHDIRSIADGVGTNAIEEEDSASSHICRFLMQCSMCRLVLYRNSTESGKRIQRPVFHPYFGILMGNMLSSNVIALNTYYSGLKREQQLYRYLLGNGATRAEAQAPFIRQAIIKSFSPLIANISVMGLVAFPGTMIGQILGGSSPNVAIKYQMMIMVITFTASMLSLMITISLASRKSFDAYGKLLPVMVEKKGKRSINNFNGDGHPVSGEIA